MAKSIIKKQYLYEYLAVIAVSLLFLVLGLFLGGLSPIIVVLKEEGFHEIPPISDSIASWMMNALNIGVIPGALISSYGSDIFGRKYAMLSTIIPQLLSHILLYFATNIWMVYSSFFMRGIVLAMTFALVPSYISEVASAKIRGPCATFGPILLPIGGLFGGTLQAALSIPLATIIAGILGICCVPILCFIPESPYFYVAKQRNDEGKRILRKLRQTENVDKEFLEIQSALMEVQKQKNVSWSELFTNKFNLRILLICGGVQLVQQITGYLPLTGFSANIVTEAGLNLSLVVVTIIINVSNVGTTIVSIFFVDSLGRRLQFMVDCTMVILGLATLGAGYFFEHYYTSIAFGILKLVGILLFLNAYSFGFSFLPNLLSAELFPTDIKAKGVSLLMAVQAVEGFIVSMLYNKLFLIADYLPFWVFCIFTIIGLIFGYFFIPETKHKTLAEIQKEFNINP
ncbi:facilitated trehalose transporter Tret1-like [Chrysoperla carnea]|uniref:facilitated trehalose transporter Tret1-like n=1 Tax=Chrysoperla carnea TaxID=189513 RepID=UPI001D098117|nr:facilitated trehalose transporter Tret1-like [Chrysoperla carnea]